MQYCEKRISLLLYRRREDASSQQWVSGGISIKWPHMDLMLNTAGPWWGRYCSVVTVGFDAKKPAGQKKKKKKPKGG